MKFFKKCIILIFAVVLIGCNQMTTSLETEPCETQNVRKTALITVKGSEFIVEVNETDFTNSFIIDYCKNNYSSEGNISYIEFLDEENKFTRSGSQEQCVSCYYIEISDKWDTHLHWENIFTVKNCTRRTHVCGCVVCGKRVTTIAHLY